MLKADAVHHQDGGPGAALVVAARGILLHLRGGRGGCHRGVALADPERAGRAGRGGPDPAGRRYLDPHRPAVVGRRAAHRRGAPGGRGPVAAHRDRGHHDHGARDRCGRRPDEGGRAARRAGRVSVLRPVSPGRERALFLRPAPGPRRAGRAGAARPARAGGGRRDPDRRRDVHDSRRDLHRAGTAAGGVQLRPARARRPCGARRDGRAGVRQPRHPSDPAPGRGAAHRSAGRRAARGPAGRDGPRALVPRAREPHRAQPGADGELPEPDRVRHRDSRRDRGLERDPRLRRATPAQRGDPQVPRRDGRPRARRLRDPDRAAGTERQSAGHRHRPRGAGGRARFAGRAGGDRGRADDRLDGADRLGDGAGGGRRPARLGALRAGAAAGGAPRQAAPAAAPRRRARARGHRLGARRGRRPGGRGPGGGRRLAGGVAGGRPVRERRVRRGGRRAAPDRARSSCGRWRRSSARPGSRCGTPP